VIEEIQGMNKTEEIRVKEKIQIRHIDCR